MTESVYTAGYERLVEAVVQARKDAGLTQRQLAGLLGREQNYVGRVETRQRRLDFIELVQWLEACDADVEAALSALHKQVGGGRKRRKRK